MFPIWPWWLGLACIAVGVLVFAVSSWRESRARCSDDRTAAALMGCGGVVLALVGLAVWGIAAAVKIVWF